MKYILDFDGVIFNIEAFKKKMEALDIPLFPRSINTLKLIAEKDPDFKLTSLLYPDARAFIEEHSKDCIIVSTHVSSTHFEVQDEKDSFDFQLEKIIASGIKELGVEDIRVVGKEKKEELQKIKEDYGEDCVFVDDRKKYTKEAEELRIVSYWMTRSEQRFTFEFLSSPEKNEINSLEGFMARAGVDFEDKKGSV